MRITASHANGNGVQQNRVVCPNCRQLVVLESIGISGGVVAGEGQFAITVFRCPDRACHQLIVLIAKGEDIIHTFPLNKIEFNTLDIPTKVVSHLEEALTCRANNCYIASAIMLRKTLEVLCDELKIPDGTLQERVRQFSTRVIMPPALLTGLDYIRLLGNDAAHIKSKTFAQISSEEIDTTIEVIKEVLKALYQHQSLIDRLQALKKPPAP